MTLSRAFSKLALILIINLFVQMRTADAGMLTPGVKNKVKKGFTDLCTNIDSVYEVICDKTIGLFDSKIKDELGIIGKGFCNSSTSKIIGDNLANMTEEAGPLFVQFVEIHKTALQQSCLLATEKSLRLVIVNVSKSLKKKCSEGLDELLPIRLGKDKKKIRLCLGIPISAEGVCSLIVTKGCEAFGKSQPELALLTPLCEDELSKFICDDLLSAITDFIKELFNPKVDPETKSITYCEVSQSP